MLKNTLKTVLGVSCLLSLDLQAEDKNASVEKPHTKRYWVSGEYIYWKIQNSPDIVPLVISNSTIVESHPVVGESGTEVVLGGKSIHNDWRSGGRFGTGYWFNDHQSIGIEGNYFFLEKASKTSSVFSDGLTGSDYLSVPYFDVVTGEDTSIYIAEIDTYSGLATLKNSNTMQGAELNALTRVLRSCNLKIDVLGGFRFWNFFEHLTFNGDSPYIPPHAVDIYKTYETFQVNNNFYGGQFGGELDYRYHNFFLNLTGKIALGAMRETVKIKGYLLTNDYTSTPFEGTPVSYPGGYFALRTNNGKFGQTEFAAIPEINFNIGYEFAKCFRLQAGYTALYASNVLWASKQVNPNINPDQAKLYTTTPSLEGPASPKAPMVTKGLWVQGVNVGFTLKF